MRGRAREQPLDPGAQLGDAELAEQGVMALSKHKTPRAARLYVKRTERQRVRAAAKRRDFVDANETTTGVEMESAAQSRNGTNGSKNSVGDRWRSLRDCKDPTKPGNSALRD
jgi:hypothetical protein